MADLLLIDVPAEKSLFRTLLGGPDPPTIRRFSDAALQAEVDKVLASLPDDRSAAELEVGGDTQGVAVVVAVKLSAGWSIRGGASYSRDGQWGGQVSVRWTGK